MWVFVVNIKSQFPSQLTYPPHGSVVGIYTIRTNPFWRVMTDDMHPIAGDVTVSSAADIPWAWHCGSDVMSALPRVLWKVQPEAERRQREKEVCGACDRLPVTLLTALWKIAVLAERTGAAARLHAPVSPCVEASSAEQTEVTGALWSWLAQHAPLDERFRLSVKTLNAVSVIITCTNW